MQTIAGLMDMLITREIKLQSPLLASRMIRESVTTGQLRREFVRLPCEEGKVRIQSDLRRWNWAFLEARDAVGLADVSTSAILPARYYEVTRTTSYKRLYRQGQTQMKDDFESFSSGQVLTWQFTLSQHLPPGGEGGGRFTRVPDEEEFDQMLAHIGEHLGMSEWGHAYLYGRFSIKK